MRMTGAVFLGDGGRWNLLNLTASTGKLLGKYGLTEGQKRKWQISSVRLKVEQIQLVSDGCLNGLGSVGLQGA